MPVLSMTHNLHTPELQMVLLEEGAQSEKWPLAADARIKTEEDPVGVGPVVYKGRTLDEEGNYASDGTVQQAMFMFFDGDESTYAILSNQTESDIVLTVEDFLVSHGGDVATMQGNKPTNE